MPPTTTLTSSARTAPSAIYRAFDAQIDSVEKSDRSLVARINTAGLDRFNSIISPGGGKLENYRRNPVVLWEHGKDPRRFTDPIGRNLWIRTNGGPNPTTILAKTRFLEDDFSQQRWEWYRDGVLSAFSVHALPQEYGPPTAEEIRANPALANDRPNETRSAGPIIYRTWELAEYSGTAVPGNADTLVESRAAGLLDLVKRSLIDLPEDVRGLIEARAVALAEPAAVVDRYITHADGKWTVHAEDGKPMGTYDSEGAAKKRLAEIEHFKHEDEARSAPYIDAEGEAWIVRDADGSPLAAFPDCALAERCLAAMTAPRSWREIHDEELTTQQARNAAIVADVRALIELQIHGRV